MQSTLGNVWYYHSHTIIHDCGPPSRSKEGEVMEISNEKKKKNTGININIFNQQSGDSQQIHTIQRAEFCSQHDLPRRILLSLLSSAALAQHSISERSPGW